MADIKTAYGTNGQVITLTGTSLAASATAGRESTSIDNGTTNKYLDALVFAKTKMSATAVTAPAAQFIYCYASVNAGTDWPDTVTGTDAAITLNNPTQLKLLGVMYTATASTAYKGGPWSVASLFGGRMPDRWGIVVINNTGSALSAVAGDHVYTYQGIFATAL